MGRFRLDARRDWAPPTGRSVPTPSRPTHEAPDGDITAHLVAVREGGRPAFDALFDLVYERLRVLARARRSGPRLDATELVHEAYLKFVDSTRTNWNDRQHFFAVAARAMRQIVVDHARRREAAKRGGSASPTALDDHHGAVAVSAEDVLAVDQALEQLSETSPRLVQVVEACFFLGMTTDEAGELLGLSARTVKREWQKAKMLLGVMLGPPT